MFNKYKVLREQLIFNQVEDDVIKRHLHIEVFTSINYKDTEGIQHGATVHIKEIMKTCL